MLYNIVNEALHVYGGYAWWGILLGWCIALSTWASMLAGAVFPMACDEQGSLKYAEPTPYGGAPTPTQAGYVYLSL